MSRVLEGDAHEREPSGGAGLERRARVRVGVGAAVALVLVALAAAVVAALLTPGGARVEVTPSASGDSSGAASAASGSASGAAAAPLYVHVVGAVASPGLYRLAPGARVVDAIAAAGGFAADAEQGSVNLAADLTDGQQLVVAAQGQGTGVGAASGAGGSAGPGAGASGGKVDLNTADAATLETLPRIGPAMAQRIIDWREKNGGFRSVEDLLDVAGIGDATFAGLKDLVTV